MGAKLDGWPRICPGGHPNAFRRTADPPAYTAGLTASSLCCTEVSIWQKRQHSRTRRRGGLREVGGCWHFRRFGGSQAGLS